MKEILNSNIKQNVIPWDEAICAFNNTSIRNDAVAKLGIEGFKTYAFKKDYFNQTSNKETSTTENPIKSSQFSILDTSDWDKWCKKYIHPLVLNKEYDLAIDEPAPHVYTFPLFTKEFCKELIELGETKEWTNDRHEFYPTTDNLLEELGMDEIYNKLDEEGNLLPTLDERVPAGTQSGAQVNVASQVTSNTEKVTNNQQKPTRDKIAAEAADRPG